MPLRSYHAHGYPPSKLDHTLAHPWEVGFAVFTIANGLTGIVTALVGDVTFAAGLDALPPWTLAALCAALVVGGVLIVAGIYDEHEDLMVGYTRERLGLWLFCTAWLVYSVVAGFAFPLFLGWRFGIVIAGCGGLRLWATYREEHRLRHPDALEPSPLVGGVISNSQAAANVAQLDASAAQVVATAAQDVATEAMAAVEAAKERQAEDED